MHLDYGFLRLQMKSKKFGWNFIDLQIHMFSEKSYLQSFKKWNIFLSDQKLETAVYWIVFFAPLLKMDSAG